jgi:pimeloyl-ACP methyl ester carboxylesterase
MWKQFAEEMPGDVRIFAVDLLGFGKSPKPGWSSYDAATQARSVIKTLLLNRIPLGSVFVGHSLGSLVAVEVARRVSRYPSSLILVSPPIYKPSRNKRVATQREDILRGVYKILLKYPRNTEKALAMAKKYYIKRTGLVVAPEVHITSFLLALETSIINQSTIDHITDVRPPIRILSGSRDPLVINKNLSELAKKSDTISHVVVRKAGHNVIGVMKDGLKTQSLETILQL